MKLIWTLLAALALSLSTTVQPFTSVPVSQAAGKGRGDDQEWQHRQKHIEDYLQRHTDRSGKVRPDLEKKAIDAIKHMKVVAALPRGAVGTPRPPAPKTATSGSPSPTKVRRRARPKLIPGGVVGVQWEQIGPAPLRITPPSSVDGKGPDSGEVVDIAVDPRGTTDQTMYIATNDGGIWKTTDGGNTWAPKTDFMPSLSMGAVALDPSNPAVVYAGTGNPQDGGGRYCCLGAYNLKAIGIYKSIDGGDTWSILNPISFTQPTGIFTGVGIYRIVVPAPNVVLVATGFGLYRSVDGGQTFGNNAPAYNNSQPILSGDTNDLKLDTRTPSTVYVTVSGFDYATGFAAANGGIYKSVDAGATFGANAPSFNDGNPLFQPAGSFGLVALSQAAPPNDATMYAAVEDRTSKCTARVYQSTNAGSSWTQQSATGIGGCQFGYDLTAGVDPQDFTRVYVGMVDFWGSPDGGNTFTNLGDSDNHDDNHALVFSPQGHWTPPPTHLFIGTDGGISEAVNGGLTSTDWTNPDEGIGTNLIYNLDIGRGSPTNNGYSYAGTQDTGLPDRQPGFPGTDWHLATGGDGGPIVVDPANGQHAYGAYNGQLVVTSDGGNSWPAASATGLPHNACCGIVGNLAIDPNNGANVFAINGSSLYLSTDSAGSFTLMKTFPSGPTVFNPGIGSVATVQSDSNALWVASADGTVWSSTNALSGALSTWTQHTVNGAPTDNTGKPYPVSDIAIDPTNTQKIVIDYPGFTGLTPVNRTKHVFESTDGGATWTDISGTDGGNPSQNLPDVPLSSVVIDPGTTPHGILVASDAAVLRSVDNGATWQILGAGFPTTLAASMQMDSSANPSLLRVGTYGRSVYELRTGTGLSVNSNLAFGTVPVGGSATSIVQVFNVSSSDLHISSFSRVFGSTDFTIISGPPPPVTLSPGEEIDYTVEFAPTRLGPETAQFQIMSDDSSTPVWTIPASGVGGGPLMTVSGSLSFGTVARGTTATRDITVYDAGSAPLTISSVAFDPGSDASFSVVGPATPRAIQAGEQVSFTIQFAPPAGSTGAQRTGTLRIKGYDALYPALTVPDQLVNATGTPGVPVATIASSSVAFGSIPVDDRTTPYYADQIVSISNQASCPQCDLHVTSLAGLSATDFTLVAPPALPATVAAGNHLDLTVRFNPSAGGSRTATLAIGTDDPANPTLTVSLSGVGLLPAISPAPATLVFPPVVYDPICSPSCGATQNETITDSGQAELILDSLLMTSGSPPFTAAAATSPLTRVQQSNSFGEAVTFHPTAAARAVRGTLQIQDLVNGEIAPITQTVPVCGEAVGRGIRVLVKDISGNTITTVDKLSLQSHGLTQPVNIQLKDLSLTTINPPTSCQQIQFHYENQSLQAVGTAANRGSYYVLTVSVGSRKATLSFTLGVNEFKQITLTVQ